MTHRPVRNPARRRRRPEVGRGRRRPGRLAGPRNVPRSVRSRLCGRRLRADDRQAPTPGLEPTELTRERSTRSARSGSRAESKVDGRRAADVLIVPAAAGPRLSPRPRVSPADCSAPHPPVPPLPRHDTTVPSPMTSLSWRQWSGGRGLRLSAVSRPLRRSCCDPEDRALRVSDHRAATAARQGREPHAQERAGTRWRWSPGSLSSRRPASSNCSANHSRSRRERT